MRGDGAVAVTAVSTDTRKIAPGSLFVALVGDRFDAHDFLDQAVAAGAAAVLVSQMPSLDDSVPVILVPDTLTGLQSLARGYREILPAKRVVITGSNGKTSTKDMIRGVLESQFQVTATAGNFNNHIGLPLTILNTEETDAYGVWEIGMNHPGEIAPLAAIAGPDIGVITNIGTAHIGNMGSREAIALEKGMLAEALSEEGLLVLNADDDFTSTIRERTPARVMTAGIEQGDIQATNVTMVDGGAAFELVIGDERAPVRLPVPGRHMISNALLAAAVGSEAGLSVPDIAQALSAVHLTPGRLQILEHAGVRVVNDAYNANPDSVRASLQTARAMEVTGKRFAVLGEMGELGDESAEAHRAMGELAFQEGFDHICSVGDGARGLTESLPASSTPSVHHFTSHEEAARFLTETTVAGDLVLLKGSRSAAMDRIYELFATPSP